MKFDAYDLDPSVYDEMFLPDGTPREHYQTLYGALRRISAEELGGVQERATRSFSHEGISFTVYGEAEAREQIIPIDCLSRVLSGADWQLIESGLSQRLTSLNLFLQDIYNEARIVSDGVIPADVIRGCPQYRCAPTTVFVSSRTICASHLVFPT